MGNPLEDLMAEMEAETAAREPKRKRFRVIEGGKEKKDDDKPLRENPQ